jgi:hypothetical protein
MRPCALGEELSEGYCRAALFTILGWGGGRREETETNKDNEIPLVQ